jgi:hypothetical protein
VGGFFISKAGRTDPPVIRSRLPAPADGVDMVPITQFFDSGKRTKPIVNKMYLVASFCKAARGFALPTWGCKAGKRSRGAVQGRPSFPEIRLP